MSTQHILAAWCAGGFVAGGFFGFGYSASDYRRYIAALVASPIMVIPAIGVYIFCGWIWLWNRGKSVSPRKGLKYCWLRYKAKTGRDLRREWRRRIGGPFPARMAWWENDYGKRRGNIWATWTDLLDDYANAKRSDIANRYNLAVWQIRKEGRALQKPTVGHVWIWMKLAFLWVLGALVLIVFAFSSGGG